jgi:hypothetical protein
MGTIYAVPTETLGDILAGLVARGLTFEVRESTRVACWDVVLTGGH